MTDLAFRFQGKDIPFRAGETIAAALMAAGITDLGRDGLGQANRYFCGIGLCQCCLVTVDGVAREACLTPARSGAIVDVLEPRDV